MSWVLYFTELLSYWENVQAPLAPPWNPESFREGNRVERDGVVKENPYYFLSPLFY